MNGCVKTISKTLMLTAAIILASGCELLNVVNLTNKETNAEKETKAAVEVKKENLCKSEAHKKNFGQFCEIDYWVDYIFEIKQLEWTVRYPQTNELGDKPSQLIKKILLSQGADTPYQNRLRAQNWIVKVSTDAPPTMRKVLTSIVYENSKQLLEFESAITILSQVNARQEKTIVQLQSALIEQELLVEKQQSQIEQLLKIEADLIKNNRE